MVRWFHLALVSTLIATPAWAQGKKQPPAPAAKKTEEARPAPTAKKTEEAPPKKKPVKVEDDEEETTEAKRKPKNEGDAEGESRLAQHSVSLFGAAALSTSNASNSITPLPFLGVSYAYEKWVSPKLSLRIEPTLSVLRRKSQVTVVRKVDASDYPNVKISTENVTNQVTALDLGARMTLGLDYTDSLRGRAGFLLGLGTAATGASACQDDSRITSLSYGLHAVPVAVRFGAQSNFELGLVVELRSQKIPRCDVPLKQDFEVNASEIAVFTPKIVEQQLTVLATGLQAGLSF